MLTLKTPLVKLTAQTARRHYRSSPPSLHLPIILSHLCTSVALTSCLVIKFKQKRQLGEHHSHSLSVSRFLAASWHIKHFCKVASLMENGTVTPSWTSSSDSPSQAQQCGGTLPWGQHRRQRGRAPAVTASPLIYEEANITSSWVHLRFQENRSDKILKQPVVKDGPSLLLNREHTL